MADTQVITTEVNGEIVEVEATKKNIFVKGWDWVKKNPGKTCAIVLGVTAVGYTIYKVVTNDASVTPTQEIIDNSGTGRVDLPEFLDFDTMKAVKEDGTVIGDVIDMGGDWVAVSPVDAIPETTEEIVAAVTEGV